MTDSRRLLFGREPAMLAEIVASALVWINLLLVPGLDPGLQALINALLTAAASGYVAIRIRSDNLLPLLVAAFKAALFLIVGLGVPLDEPAQAAILTFISLVAGTLVRSQVDAPVTKQGVVVYSRTA